jgi:hypothetical protein
LIDGSLSRLPAKTDVKMTLTQQTIIDMFGPETGFTGFFRFSMQP